jgi:hypothetical protein
MSKVPEQRQRVTAHVEARSRRPQIDWGSKTEGLELTAERRLLHGCLHVVAPHWSFKK